MFKNKGKDQDVSIANFLSIVVSRSPLLCNSPLNLLGDAKTSNRGHRGAA